MGNVRNASIARWKARGQWRSHKLRVGGPDPNAGGARGARVEAPKAPSGVGSAEECPLASRLGSLGERRELPQ